MSKKKRASRASRASRAPARTQRSTATEASARGLHPRRLITVAALATAAAAITVAVLRLAPRGPIAFPLPPPADTPASAEEPAFADFVGAETCEPCHAEQYASWKGSTHGRAGGPPTKEVVIAPFNGVPMRFKDAVVTPSVSSRGEYLFTVAQKDRPVRTYRVDQVVGGGFLAGGGTQAFFSRFPDGTLRFLPFDYPTPADRWFCNTRTGPTGGGGAVPVTPDLALADCLHWTPNRILGSTDRFQGCQQCHGSQIAVEFNPDAHRYDTRFTTLAINCESCHGPGRRHVELSRSGKIGERPDVGMRALETLSKDRSLQVCFQCHAIKTQLQPGYLPGRPLERHFALKLPLLVDAVYFADGRTRTFAYQEGHLASDCYLSGSMTCVDCHDPHTQRYRDANRLPLRGRFDDGQCLACHPSKAQPLERHTHHRAASPGSRCVACHMPYLQQPTVGRQIPYARSDHTIPIPRPLYDERLGVESACQQCHRDQTGAGLQSQVARWYGELKPHPKPVTAALAADSVADPRLAARRILAADGNAPLAEFAGLARLLERYATPDAPEFDREMTDRLKQRAASPDPEIQALALATLHLARGAEAPVRRFLAGRLRALGAHDRGARDRWAWILRSRGDAYINGGDYRSALLAYQRANEIKPGDAALLRELGIAYTRLGEHDRAVEHFRKSLERNPAQAQVWAEIGYALQQRGDLDGATEAYRSAVALSRWDPIGYANLGIALFRRGEVESSIEALEAAVSLDPSLADANFALANAYATLGRLRQAAAALEQGLEFDPRNPGARQMLEEMRRRIPSSGR